MFNEKNTYVVERGASKEVKFYWAIGKLFQYLAAFTFAILWIISEQYHNNPNTKYPDWFEQMDATWLFFGPAFVWISGYIIIALCKLFHWWDRGGIE